MKKYNFRLERLLRIRRYKERLWEMKLAEITGKCVQLENTIRDLQSEKDAHSSFFAGGVPYSAEDILIQENFRRRLARETEETVAQLEKARKKREEVNRSCMAASRDRKVLDKLKERKAEEYYEEQRGEERKKMDEFAMYRATGAALEGDE
jgi:flagellar FliJ protein